MSCDHTPPEAITPPVEETTCAGASARAVGDRTTRPDNAATRTTLRRNTSNLQHSTSSTTIRTRHPFVLEPRAHSSRKQNVRFGHVRQWTDRGIRLDCVVRTGWLPHCTWVRSEEHTSEL